MTHSFRATPNQSRGFRHSRTILLVLLLMGAGIAGAEAPDRARLKPTLVRLQPGTEQAFKVIIEAPRFNYARLAEKVTWSVNDVAGGNSAVGTIDAKGVYRAPASIPVPHEVHVRAEVEGVANRYLWATVLVGDADVNYKPAGSFTDPPDAGRFQNPHSIFVDRNGNLLIADEGSNRVFRFAKDGRFINEIGLGPGRGPGRGLGRPAAAPADSAPGPRMFGPPIDKPGHFAQPRVALEDASGQVFVVDVAERRPMIQVFDGEGHFLRGFGRWGTLPGELLMGHGMAFDSHQRLFLVDIQNVRVNIYDHSGSFVSSWGKQGTFPGEVNAIHGISIDANDEVFLNSYYGPTQKFTADGRFLLAFAYADPPDHASSFQSICGDRWGNVYVTAGRDGLAKYSNTGEFLGWVVQGRSIQWAAVDNQGTVYLLPARFGRSAQPRATVEIYAVQ